jgi:glycosyltransferase involved in cell wall biosynthesis
VLVPARDARAIADALRHLGEHEGQRRVLGAAGRARVEARFSLDRMVAAYRDIYTGAA